MATSPTYPGVYIEELPSGVRTITGVATSITAFLGRALRGPVNDPTRIQKWGDFERTFGGLWYHSTMSYAVQQFFQNGGGDALIVRLVDEGEAATLSLPTTGTAHLVLSAKRAGTWGNYLRATFVNSTGLLTIELLHPSAGTVIDTETFTITTATTSITSDYVEITSFDSTVPSDLSATSFSGGEDGADTSFLRLPTEDQTFSFQAVSTGTDGNSIKISIDHFPYDRDNTTLFNVKVDDGNGGVDWYVGQTPSTFAATLAADTGAIVSLVGTLSGRPAEVTEQSLSGGTASVEASATFHAVEESLALESSSGGTWANYLQATVDYDTSDSTDTTLFNLTIDELDDETGDVVSTETHRNLSLDPESSRYITLVLEEESDLALVYGDLPADRPAEMEEQAFAYGTEGGVLEDSDFTGSETEKTGIYALELADLFNLMCLPPLTRDTDISADTWDAALAYCKTRRAMLIMDPPSTWSDVSDAVSGVASISKDENAALFFPRVYLADRLRKNLLTEFVPCGVVAGVFARTDGTRGVWKAPAGLEATLSGVRKLALTMTDGENGQLNPLGVNCLRVMPAVGPVVWGSRTTEGADRLASEWKYIPVRRLALYIEESLYRGTQWVVFEPNDEPLWAQIRLNVGAFMHNLFRQGAFQGRSPKEAYFVKCDSESTTQNDINLGIVNVIVGFAPLKPAEFVIIKLQQMAGQIEV